MNDAIKDDQSAHDPRLELAMEALELANGVMDYCGGDAWEREATAEARGRFDEIYAELSPPDETTQATSDWLQRTKCPHCGKKVSGAPGAIENHHRDKHSEIAIREVES